MKSPKPLITNIKLFQEAQKYIPGGVNSPVRAFKSVGGIPLFIKKGNGSKIYSVEKKNNILTTICHGEYLYLVMLIQR